MVSHGTNKRFKNDTPSSTVVPEVLSFGVPFGVSRAEPDKTCSAFPKTTGQNLDRPDHRGRLGKKHQLTLPWNLTAEKKKAQKIRLPTVSIYIGVS